MFRILTAMDFSECSRVALSAALEVAERAAPTELLVMTVIVRRPKDGEIDALGEIERQVDALRHMVDEVRANRPAADGVSVRYLAVQGIAAEEIVHQASAHHVDVIVVGTHGRTGLDRLLLGSVAETVVRTAPCSVLTVKPRK